MSSNNDVFNYVEATAKIPVNFLKNDKKTLLISIPL